MPCILSLDQGTTSSRAIVFGDDGAVLGNAQQELTQHYPRPGWVEHDAEEIWTTVAGTASRALRAAGLHARDLAAIGLTNQRESVVIWDRATGDPVGPAIVWQDRRTAGRCERLRAEGAGPLVRERTGLRIDAYFSATKLAWILDASPPLRKRAERGELAAGTIDAWLLHRLTGGAVHATDATNASRTLLCDIRTGAWDDELLDLFDVPAPLLPRIVDSAGVVATAAEPAALRGAPIAGIAGDQQAALVGSGCATPGLAKNTYGTGCFLLVNTGAEIVPPEGGLLSTIGWQLGGVRTCALEGSVFIGGAVVQWLRDGLGIIDRSADVERLAASVPDTGDVFLVPAFTGLGAPHWDEQARGAIVGMTRGTTSAHIARAALEAIAFQVADLVDAMERSAGRRIPELRVDGGAAANDLLLQIQADLLRRPVVRPAMLETTSLGAALLAGLAVGTWPSLASGPARAGDERHFEPRLGEAAAAALRERWRKAVDCARGWAAPEA